MSARLSPAPPAQGSDLIARAVGAAALAALAMIHVIDLPGTLGFAKWVGEIHDAGLVADLNPIT